MCRHSLIILNSLNLQVFPQNFHAIGLTANAAGAYRFHSRSRVGTECAPQETAALQHHCQNSVEKCTPVTPFGSAFGNNVRRTGPMRTLGTSNGEMACA